MAVPLFWNPAVFLRAFGNTPVYSVAQYLEPEDPAEILLLGCGDARTVLYTVYATGADSPNNTRKLDFTCSDAEPAVLARNAVLYSLLKDDPTLKHIDRIWSIYHDLLLDDGAIALLRAHCAKLHAASASLDTWATSSYASYMRLATAHSLDELHRLFGLFLAPDVAQLTRAFKAGMAAAHDKHRDADADSNALGVLRAAGPLWMQFGIELAGALRTRYWATNAKHANPTLAFSRSSERFPLHTASLPWLGFHLAEVAADRLRDSATVQDVETVCKAQFRAWCAAFASARNVVVRFCVGDASAVCRALARSKNSTGALFAAPWTNTPLVLLDGGPRRFTAIDSGTLADDLGLINVLLLAAPLLALSPSDRSVLYTESLHASAGSAVQSFRTALCGTPGAMALLLGIAPAGALDGALSASLAHEIMLARVHAAAAGAGCERVAWRRLPAAGARLLFDPAELARLLVDVHYELFQSEDAAALRPRFLAAGVGAGLAAPPVLQRLVAHITYVRGTFVALLAQLRARLLFTDAQWVQVVKEILDKAGQDRRLMIGDCSYQDLCLHLHAAGLAPELVPHFSRVPGAAIDVSAGPLARWPREKIGKAVWAALSVPVSAFGTLDGVKPPHELFFATRMARGLNYFATFSAFRGSVTQRGATFNVKPDDGEDADVVVLALVPAWLVMADPRTTMLSVAVRPGALGGEKLLKRLGQQMEVFSASVLDAQRAFFASEAPTIAGVSVAPLYDVQAEQSGGEVVTVALDASKKGNVGVATMMLRADVKGAGEQEAWSAKKDVEVVQLEPAEAEVRTVCRTFARRLRFPLPVDVRNARLRVARKSFWVEVIAPLAQPMPSPPSPRFHAVNLDRLPVLDTAREPPQWLDMHAQFAFSDAERANRDGPRESRLPRVDVKDDILTLILRSAGLAGEESAVRALVLSERDTGDAGEERVYAIIFVKEIRLDAAAGTVVADAYVLPEPGDAEVDVRAGAFRHAAQEAALWRRLLVAFAERCRGGAWAHKPACTRPRDRLCACGARANVPAVREWTRAPVTRVAIGLPCAPQFLAGVGGHMPNFAREHGGTSAADFFEAFAPTGRSVAEYGLAAGPGARRRAALRAAGAKETVGGRCARCGNEEAKVLCPKCGKVRYCDKNCLRMHAKAHKAACTES